jgi:hypothetical protein
MVMESFPEIVNDLMERLENELWDRMEVMESRILSRHMNNDEISVEENED